MDYTVRFSSDNPSEFLQRLQLLGQVFTLSDDAAMLITRETLSVEALKEILGKFGTKFLVVDSGIEPQCSFSEKVSCICNEAYNYIFRNEAKSNELEDKPSYVKIKELFSAYNLTIMMLAHELESDKEKVEAETMSFLSDKPEALEIYLGFIDENNKNNDENKPIEKA